MRMVAVTGAGRMAIVRSPHQASGREQGSDTRVTSTDVVYESIFE
ncbi:hypothetical protein [Nonomuraea diastatica]|nr:hypothetical protein [Nonomuraea diastatica]